MQSIRWRHSTMSLPDMGTAGVCPLTAAGAGHSRQQRTSKVSNSANFMLQGDHIDSRQPAEQCLRWRSETASRVQTTRSTGRRSKPPLASPTNKKRLQPAIRSLEQHCPTCGA